MTNENFDHIINQKLHHYAAPVPDGLWDKIQVPALEVPADGFDEYVKASLKDFIAPVPADMWEKVKPKEEERRRFFLLPRTSMIAASILLLVLAGSVSAYLYYQRTHFTEPIENANTVIPTQKNSASAGQNNSPKATTLSSIGIETDENENSSTTNSSSTINNINNQLNNSTNNSQLQSSSYPFNLSSKSVAKSKLLTGFELANTVNNKEAIIATTNEQSISYAEEDAYQLTDKAGNAYYFRTKNNKLFTAEKSITDFNHANTVKNVIICPSDRKIRNTDWDVEVYASPDYAFKSITNNTASQQFMSRKDSGESMRIGFTAGFRIVKPLNDHILLKTGLQYSQINEKFSYRTENEIKTTTVVTVRTIIRAPGDTVIIRDTSSVQQIGYKNNTVKNRYRSIDIPVLLGYQFGNDDLKIGINAGVIFNLTSWYQGVLLDSSLAPVPITKESSHMTYKKNIGLGLYAGVSITKRINYSTLVFVEPYMRYNLSNMTTPQASYSQRFTLGGLSVGLRLNLNSR